MTGGAQGLGRAIAERFVAEGARVVVGDIDLEAARAAAAELGSAALAVRCDVASEDDPVLADLAEGRARGVVGSPHFFARGLDVFCPTLRIRTEDGQFHVEQAGAELDRLWAASFA